MSFAEAMHSYFHVHIKTNVLRSQKCMKVLFEKEFCHYLWEDM